MKTPRLILASTSPRRAELLRRAAIPFDIIAPPFDESSHRPRSDHPADIALELAVLKARSVAASLHEGLILGCDTLAELDGRPIDKPADRADAERILRALLGRTHRVVTAVCLIDAATARTVTLTDAADVEMGEIDEAALAAYLDSGDWRGKAGGYNLDQMTGRWPITVAGDPATVVGLPMQRLIPLLRRIHPDLVPHTSSPA